MAAALPFPLILPTVPTPAGAAPVAAATTTAVTAGSGAIGGFDFATLMAAQIDASNPASTTIPAILDEIAAAAPVVIATGASEALPSEALLIQAAGGADTSTALAEQAVALAIDSGIAPVPSERLVLATALPVVVQTAASVHALDRLLDKLSGPVPAGLTHMVKQFDTAAGSPVTRLGEAVAARTAQVHDALRASIDSALQNHDRGALIERPGAIETASPIVMDTAGASRQPNALGTPTMARVPITPGTPFTLPPNGRQVADSFNLNDTDHALRVAVRAPVAQNHVPNNPTGRVPHGFALAPDLDGSGAPADTPGTSQPRGEPAALSSGKSSTTAVEILQQRFASLGVDADVWTTIERVTTDARPNAASAVPLGSPAAPVMPSSVGGTPITHDGTNGPSAGGAHAPSSGLTEALTADTNGSSSNGQGGDAGGFGKPGAAFGSSDEAGFFAGDSIDGSAGFSTLMANQSSAASAPRAPSGTPPGHPPLPPVSPDQIAVHIAEAARNGARNITIQLRPAALGRIEVELSVGRDGAVRSRVLAERSETLDLLQRDVRGLERALEAAGLRAETGGLSFGLKHGGQHGHQTFDQTTLQSAMQTGGNEQLTAPPSAAYQRAWSDSHALDIEV